jgi:protein SCO1/2
MSFRAAINRVSRRAFAKVAMAMLIVSAGGRGLAAAVAIPSSLSDETLLQIKFDQRLGASVALERQFRDDAGSTIRLGDYFGRKPVILVMGYYDCPMLCSLVLNGAVTALQDLRAKPGKDFEIVSVSVDPTETPALAAAKKRTYVKRYGRDDPGTGWHFLTGDEIATKQLAAEVGFRYAFDARLKEYAHPSGLIVLTPDGKVSRYLFGVSFSAAELDAALKEAGRKQIGSPIEQLWLLCFHYSPLTGKYGDLVMGIVRTSGVVTLAGLGWMVIGFARRRRAQLAREGGK